jgi:hypothetical protein
MPYFPKQKPLGTINNDHDKIEKNDMKAANPLE